METEQQDNNEAGVQGSTKPVPFAPTTEIVNADGVAIAWDLIEQTSREFGIPTAASKYKVDQNTIQARKRLKKWKRIPDMRGHRKSMIPANAQLQTMEGDLSKHIDRHRATVFEKTSKSIAKFRPKAPRNFREFDAADKIARRALGIDDDKPTLQQTIIKINEAINSEDAQPIEAEVIPCNPEPRNIEASEPSDSLGQIESGEQGSNEPSREPAHAPQTEPSQNDHTLPMESVTNHNKPAHSLTLNAGDSKARRFVVP
jgi:hypothetical protein